jgi:hypothetical protein
MQLSPSASSANQSKVQPRYSGGSGNQPPLGMKFLLIPALVATLVLATSHIAFATTYTGDGWHDGYTDGRADCLANQPNDPQVDPGNDDSYNAMYKLGYGAGYLAASTLYHCGT